MESLLSRTIYTNIYCLSFDILNVMFQVLFKDGLFQWKRLENLIVLAKENVAKMSSNPALQVRNTYVFYYNTIVEQTLHSCLATHLHHSVILTRPHLFRQTQRNWKVAKKLDLTDTIKDGARLFFVDEGIRRQLLLALTEDSKLHIEEVCPNDICYFSLLLSLSLTHTHTAHNHNIWFTAIVQLESLEEIIIIFDSLQSCN